MSEMERNFVKEYKEMMQYRLQYLGNNRAFAIENMRILPLPLQSQDTLQTLQKHQIYAQVDGITEEYFKQLNGTKVIVYPENTPLTRPVLDSNNKIMCDANGVVITKKIPIPKGCAVIATTINIKLPNYKVDAKGEKVLYKVKDKSYKYATCISTKNEQGTGLKTRYFYIVPKTVLYKINTVSLVISARPRRKQAYYESIRLQMQNGAYVYVSVMPTEKITDTTEMRIICTKISTDFTKEISALMRYWQTQVAYVQADGRKFTYLFPFEETTITIDGNTQNLAVTRLDNVNNTLDKDLYIAREDSNLAEATQAIDSNLT